MQTKISPSDTDCEKGAISCCLNYGSSIFYVNDIEISQSDFHDTFLGDCYYCISKILERDNSINISESVMVSELSKVLNLSDKNKERITSIKNSVVGKEDYSVFLRQIKFWSISRCLKSSLLNAAKKLDGLTGSESVVDIISETEKLVLDFIPGISGENEITKISSFAETHLKYLAENPVLAAGIPTGFPRYDKAVGGGYRRGSVNVVGARPKVGKSTLCLNIASNLAKQNIPVLYLDTEMKKETQAIKWVSIHSDVSQSLLETGQFIKKEVTARAVDQALIATKTLPFYHISVAGKKPEEILSISRKWLSMVVGKDEGGNTKDCLVILDYLKTMDISDVKNVQEYQYLGDFITKLHNFSVKQDIPILATVQLNRDGINKEDTSVVSGSDRILWLCSSLAYLKKKTEEDVAAGDSKCNGDRKMVVIETRYGQGMDSTSEYINIISDLDKSRFIEGKFNFEVLESSNDNHQDNHENSEIEF